MSNAISHIESNFQVLFTKFLKSSKKGKRIQKNGKRIQTETLSNYETCQKILLAFCQARNFELRILPLNRMNKKQVDTEQKYWKKFYSEFTAYLYNDLGYYDNYVGVQIKVLRTFFNYLHTELGIHTGRFHEQFYVPSEEIQIVVLSPQRLHYLIHTPEFRSGLPEHLQEVLDIFIIGCTVGLRFSDLMNLKPTNLVLVGNTYYLHMLSSKTQMFTRVKLPDYAVVILQRQQKTRKYLLPTYHKVYLNLYLKEIIEKAGWTEPFERTRNKRGKPVIVYKNKEAKTPFRFCDMITTHTMRRTAITTMLTLGMNEQMVRKISGHGANSKEFYRYVTYSQAFVDKEIDHVHAKLGAAC